MGRNTKLSYAWAVSLSLVYVKNVTASTQRRDQECPPPAGGCSGPGLWDDQSCQCLCVENYCYDSMAGTCSTWGNCPNDFAGCTPKVDCPYFVNSSTGKCESGEIIAAGVFELFWTEYECCMKAFSWDPSSCITEIRSPSAGPTTMASTTPQSVYHQSGFVLEQIPIRLINAPDINLSNIESSKVKDIIRTIAEDEVDILNVDVIKVDIADMTYADRKLTLNDYLGRQKGHSQRYLESVLTLLIEISVSETSILPHELYSTIIGSLQLRKYEIDQVLRDSLGPQYNGVILEIDGHKTTLSPSVSPRLASDTIRESVTERGTGTADVETAAHNNTMTIVMVVLCSVFFAAVTFGLIFWQRKRERIRDKAFVTRSNQYHHRKRSPRKRHRRKSKRKLNAAEAPLEIANYPYVDEEQGKMDKKLMIGYVPQTTQAAAPEVQPVPNEEVFELGYDGGQSSFLGSQGNMSNSSFNAASVHRDAIDPEEGSVGDNVLGLLYYAGASSSDEQDDPDESKKKARMQRRTSNASSRQTRTSSRSRRSSISGKSKSSHSLKSKSSRTSRRPSREQTAHLQSVDEDENLSFHREEYFHQFADEPSLGDVDHKQNPALRSNSRCSVSVSTVSDDEEYTRFGRRKTLDTTFTEDATSLNVDDLFT